MWLEALHQAKDHAEKCPTCGGGVQRRLYGEMHAGSSVLNGQRVEICKRPAEGFADPIVLDPLTQYFDGGLYRLWPSERYFSRGGKKLHREVWRVAFGNIPKGSHIHHRDRNASNNALSNLECVEASEHLSQTWRESPKARLAPDKHFTERARAAAADWHRSEEGRLWHRRHMERVQSWTKWRRVKKQCLFCNNEFVGVERKTGYSQKYCCANCKAAYYRKRKAAAGKI